METKEQETNQQKEGCSNCIVCLANKICKLENEKNYLERKVDLLNERIGISKKECIGCLLLNNSNAALENENNYLRGKIDLLEKKLENLQNLMNGDEDDSEKTEENNERAVICENHLHSI